MKKILVILFILAFVQSDSLEKSHLVNKDPPQLCEYDKAFKQGTYDCEIIDLNKQKKFTPRIDGQTVTARQVIVRSECENYQFYDMEENRCVSDCESPKIKNFVNGSCETKEKILEEIPHLAFFTYDGLSVFSEKNILPIEVTSKNELGQPCPLIDLKTRTCLQNLEDCNGIIIDSIFCKTCNCENITQEDKVCKKKCECNEFFYQTYTDQASFLIRPSSKKYVYNEIDFVCKSNCQKQDGLAQSGNHCIPVFKCHFIVEYNICLKDCGKTNKINPYFYNNNSKCTECLRIEKNRQCSDKCPKLDQILVYNSSISDFQCEDKSNHLDLVLFENEGCSYPFVLSFDGTQCLTQCPSGQKHYYVRQGLSKCIKAYRCEPEYSQSSDRKYCAINCGLFFEVPIGRLNRCKKCKDETPFFYQDQEKQECRKSNDLIAAAFTLENVLQATKTKYILQFLDRIEERIIQIKKSIKELPATDFRDRYERLSQFQAYFKVADEYHKRLIEFQNVDYTQNYYFNTNLTSGFGIEQIIKENEEYKQYHSLENIIEGVNSVRFEVIRRDKYNYSRISQHIQRIDNASICDLQKNCKETTIFFNFCNTQTIMPIFTVNSLENSEIQHHLCLHEQFEKKNEGFIHKVNVSPGKKLNENEIACPSFTDGGVGLISLNNEELISFQSVQEEIIS